MPTTLPIGTAAERVFRLREFSAQGAALWAWDTDSAQWGLCEHNGVNPVLGGINATETESLMWRISGPPVTTITVALASFAASDGGAGGAAPDLALQLLVGHSWATARRANVVWTPPNGFGGQQPWLFQYSGRLFSDAWLFGNTVVTAPGQNPAVRLGFRALLSRGAGGTSVVEVGPDVVPLPP